MLGLIYLASQAISLWLISLKTRDTSTMDRFWGLSFVIYLGLNFYASPSHLTGWLLMLILTLWGTRLSFFITVRNWGKGEDQRYAAMRASIPHYSLHALWMVFCFQGFLVALIASPCWYAILTPHRFGWAQALGLLIWSIGWLWECVADAQMKRFQKLRDHPQAICQHGVWAWSRHPNYFGEALLWWGFWVMCSTTAPWWSIISPILMTYLLRYFTGVGPLESDQLQRKPDYQQYIHEVPCFIPSIRLVFRSLRAYWSRTLR
jgi:steroid 5-alpha reductase family enzyme